MTERFILSSHYASALVLILTVSMLGCGTTAQSNRQEVITTTLDASPTPKTEEVLLSSVTPSDVQHNEAEDFDEEQSIFFSLGSNTISPTEKVKLRRIVSLLKADKSSVVRLVGHANDNGSRSFNLAVADARVESVSSYLRKQGVNPRQITKLVIGSEKIPSTCKSAECRQRMRRVEISITPSERERSNVIAQ